MSNPATAPRWQVYIWEKTVGGENRTLIGCFPSENRANLYARHERGRAKRAGWIHKGMEFRVAFRTDDDGNILWQTFYTPEHYEKAVA